MRLARFFTTRRGVLAYAMLWCACWIAVLTYGRSIGRGPLTGRTWMDGGGPLVYFGFAFLIFWRRWRGARTFLLLGWTATCSTFVIGVIHRAWTTSPDKGPILPWAVPLMAVLGSGGTLLTYVYVPADSPSPGTDAPATNVGS